MYNKIFKHFFVVALIAVTVTFANAQNQPKQQDAQPPAKYNHDMKPGQPNSCSKAFMGIPDLTPDQITKLDDLKLQHIKEVTPLRNQMNEKQARINTLLDVDKADMAAINSAIDEFTGVSNQLMKKKAEFQLSIRNVLTDKQKIVYDSKSDLFNDEGCCPEGPGKKGPGPGAGPNNCPHHK